MKRVLILGAGHVTKPIVDYLTQTCGYDVTMAARTVSKAEKIIAGRPKAKVVHWASQEEEKLDGLITEHDIVINMIPKAQHVMVAKLCLKHQKDMVTTSYEIPPIKALDAECRERGILILNELGEDPGMDHFAVQMLLEEIAAEGARSSTSTPTACRTTYRSTGDFSGSPGTATTCAISASWASCPYQDLRPLA